MESMRLGETGKRVRLVFFNSPTKASQLPGGVLLLVVGVVGGGCCW